MPLSLVPAASAAALTATGLKMGRTSPITYANPQTTFSGTLENGPSAASPGQGIGAEPVDLTLMTPDGTAVEADLGTVTTAADGTFSLTATMPHPGLVYARFAGDSAHAATF